MNEGIPGLIYELAQKTAKTPTRQTTLSTLLIVVVFGSTSVTLARYVFSDGSCDPSFLRYTFRHCIAPVPSCYKLRPTSQQKDTPEEQI